VGVKCRRDACPAFILTFEKRAQRHFSYTAKKKAKEVSNTGRSPGTRQKSHARGKNKMENARIYIHCGRYIREHQSLSRRRASTFGNVIRQRNGRALCRSGPTSTMRLLRKMEPDAA